MEPIEIQVPAALNRPGIRQLRTTLDRAFSLKSASVVVLTGTAECFCRGMDLSADFDAGVEEDVAGFAACLELIRLGPKPVVAAVCGAATAGGVGLAAAADLVIASPEATFSLTELLFGLLPAVILPYLMERLPRAKVRSWALSAGAWPAAEAKAYGLVDVVAAKPDIGSALKLWTHRLSRAQAAGLWKRYTAKAGGLDPGGGVAATVARLRDPEVMRNIRRFTENEELPWMQTP